MEEHMVEASVAFVEGALEGASEEATDGGLEEPQGVRVEMAAILAAWIAVVPSAMKAKAKVAAVMEVLAEWKEVYVVVQSDWEARWVASTEEGKETADMEVMAVDTAVAQTVVGRQVAFAAILARAE